MSHPSRGSESSASPPPAPYAFMAKTTSSLTRKFHCELLSLIHSPDLDCLGIATAGSYFTSPTPLPHTTTEVKTGIFYFPNPYTHAELIISISTTARLLTDTDEMKYRIIFKGWYEDVKTGEVISIAADLNPIRRSNRNKYKQKERQLFTGYELTWSLPLNEAESRISQGRDWTVVLQMLRDATECAFNRFGSRFGNGERRERMEDLGYPGESIVLRCGDIG